MVLQDPNIKGLLNQFIEDTQESVDEPGLNAADIIKNSDNTDQIIEQGTQAVSVENLWGGLMSLVPEDSPANEVFSWFSFGETNEGDQRKGAREDEQP